MVIRTGHERSKQRKAKIEKRIHKLLFRIAVENGRIAHIMDRGDPPTGMDVDAIQESKRRARLLLGQVEQLLRELEKLGK